MAAHSKHPSTHATPTSPSDPWNVPLLGLMTLFVSTIGLFVYESVTAVTSTRFDYCNPLTGRIQKIQTLQPVKYNENTLDILYNDDVAKPYPYANVSNITKKRISKVFN